LFLYFTFLETLMSIRAACFYCFPNKFNHLLIWLFHYFKELIYLKINYLRQEKRLLLRAPPSPLSSLFNTS